MKLFSFFSQQLSPAWEYSVPQTLWRVIFSHNGSVVCESRNTDDKTATFACLDEKTGSVRWSGKTFQERWWIGIEGIADDRLYLHGFKKPDMPEHQGIICVDLLTGSELWRSATSTFLTVHDQQVYGVKDLFERRLYYRLDPNSGAVIEELSSLPDEVDENRQLEKTDFTFPRPLSPEDEEIVRLARSLHPINQTETGALNSEYIAAGSHLVVNTYTPSSNPDKGLQNTLSVIDSATKKKVYSDVLNDSTPYPVPDSFFMDGPRIYYIKERKKLVCLELPGFAPPR